MNALIALLLAQAVLVTPNNRAELPEPPRLERLDNCERTGVWPPAFHEMICQGVYGRCSEFEKCLWEKEF